MPSTTPGKNCDTPAYPISNSEANVLELTMARYRLMSPSTMTIPRASLATWSSLIDGASTGRMRFLANSVAAVRMKIEAGTIAVRAPAPPIRPSSHAGKEYERESERVQRHHHRVAAQGVGTLRREHGPESMRPHVKPGRAHQNGGDIPRVPLTHRGPRHGEVLWMRLGQRGEHGTDASEVGVWDRNADAHRSEQHQPVLDDAHPRHGAYAVREHERHQQHHADRHRLPAGNVAEAGDLQDHAHSSDLQLYVRNQADDADEAGEAAQIAIAIADPEEVRHRLHAVAPPQLPDLRQHEEGHDVSQAQVRKGVERGSAARVGPARGAEEGERGVHLSCHQQKHEQDTETATADRPLLQIHPAPCTCKEPYRHAGCDDRNDDRH